MDTANVTASSGASIDESTSQNTDASALDQERSCDDSSSNQKKSDKKYQFTLKQRMDMYAFCVLEMEINGSKVSIRKQQQAVQRALEEKQKQQQATNCSDGDGKTASQVQSIVQQQQPEQQQPQKQQQQQQLQQQQQPQSQQLQQSISNQSEIQGDNQAPTTSSNGETSTVNGSASRLHDHNYIGNGTAQTNNPQQLRNPIQGNTCRTLQELKTDYVYKTYTDIQRVSVITTKMLREVQLRFAKYYPDCTPPSRTTIKHVFEKCVKHGTVENIRTKRRATKIPQGKEITSLLVEEPQLSLRQMARRLNVSTGTISRRCKTLGLIPDSVSAKHQQLAVAKRQRQIKKLENEQTVKVKTVCSPKKTSEHRTRQNARSK